MTARPPRNDFAYGHGRVGVLQEYLLTQADVEKMVEASSVENLAGVITELRLSNHVEYHSNPHRFINAVELWLKRELCSMVPENVRDVFNILWLKDDASLLAYLLKKHHRFTSALSAEPHVGATAFDPEDLRSIVRGLHVSGVAEDLQSFVRTMRDLRGLTPQTIDAKVSQFCIDMQLSLAQKGSEAILLYVQHHVDLQNIRTVRRLAKDDHPEEHLMRGGAIDATRLSLDSARLADLVRGSHFGSALADSIEHAEDSSVILERGLAKAIATDLARMRMNALSIDPLFAFGAIAQSQLTLLRTILIGKSARLTPAELRKLLPPFLSASAYTS